MLSFIKRILVTSVLLLTVVLLTTTSVFAATVEVEVNWQSWSSENRVSIFDANNQLLTTVNGGTNYICNPVSCFNSAANNSYGIETFTFLDVPAGDFTILMEDDFGDGWDGAGSYARVRVNGVQVINSAGPATASLTLPFTVSDTAATITSQTCSATSLTGTWNTAGPYTSTSGGIDVSIATSSSSGGSWGAANNVNMNTIAAWSDAAVQGQASLEALFEWDNTPGAGGDPIYAASNSVGGVNDSDSGGFGNMTFSFGGRTISNLIVHYDRLGGSSALANSARFDIDTAGVTLGRLAGLGHFETYANGQLYRSPYDTTSGTESNTDPSLGTAAGSVVYTGKYSNLSLDLDGVGVEGGGGDQIEFVICVPQADLSITKLVSNATPNVGENITYTVTVNNLTGPDAANNVQVTDVLPAGLSFVSAAPSQGTYTDPTGTGLWDIGSIAVAGSATLQIVATVTGSLPITNQAQISNADRVDPDSDFDTGFAVDDISDAIADDDEASALITPVAVVNCPTGSTGTGSGFASSGSGLYKEEIFWLDWQCGAVTSFLPGQTINKSWNGPNGIVITAVLDNITAAINSYTVGSYFGDLLDNMYTGVNPIGLRNAIDSQDPTFDLSFNVSLGGNSIRADIIVAEAEDSDTVNESQTVTTSGSAWEILEVAGSSNLDVIYSNANQTLTWGDASGSVGGSLLAVSENAANISVATRAGGVQAIAFGVMLSFDFGDAAGYGDASHYGILDASGGDKPTVLTDATTLTLANLDVEAPFLGAIGGDAELAQQNSASANGDDTDADGDDEDVTTPFPAVNAAATSYSITISCSGSATIVGWIDWAGDGSFNDNTIDESAVTNCSAGSATLNWSGLSGLQAGTTFVRLRTSSNATQAGAPTGLALDGEVEDHSLEISSAADISVSKTDTLANYVPGSTATYSIVINNAGPSDVSGIVITDTLPNGVTLSGAWSCVASAGSTCSAGSGGSAGDSAVNLTANVLNSGTITVTVDVQYSADPSSY